MENRNKPAYPITDSDGRIRNPETIENGALSGLSKRETIAAMCLQGLLANTHPSVLEEQTINKCIMAIEYADALLTQLEK